MKDNQADIEINSKFGFNVVEAYHLGNIGLVFQDQGKLEEALEFFQKALKIFTKLGYTISSARTMMNLGEIYSRLAEMREWEKNCKFAHDYLKRASEISIEYEQDEITEYIQNLLSRLKDICF